MSGVCACPCVPCTPRFHVRLCVRTCVHVCPRHPSSACMYPKCLGSLCARVCLEHLGSLCVCVLHAWVLHVFPCVRLCVGVCTLHTWVPCMYVSPQACTDSLHLCMCAHMCLGCLASLHACTRIVTGMSQMPGFCLYRPRAAGCNACPRDRPPPQPPDPSAHGLPDPGPQPLTLT